MNKSAFFFVKKLVHRYRLIRYHFFMFVDQLRKIDLTKAVSIEDLHLPSDSHMYYASSPALKRVLKRLKIKPTDRILDIGCGKGRALYYMSKFPFEMIAGVDISSSLTEICKKNMKKLKITNFKIFNMDASLFTEYDSFNYIYLYNPFDADVLEKCLVNINNSLVRNPRKIIIIYHNPVFKTIILKFDFKLKKRMHFNRFYIYETI